MRSLPKGNIDSSLILLCNLFVVDVFCARLTFAVTQLESVFLFCFELIFSATSYTFLHRASKIHPFESKSDFSLNLVGRKKPE